MAIQLTAAAEQGKGVWHVYPLPGGGPDTRVKIRPHTDAAYRRLRVEAGLPVIAVGPEALHAVAEMLESKKHAEQHSAKLELLEVLLIDYYIEDWRAFLDDDGEMVNIKAKEHKGRTRQAWKMAFCEHVPGLKAWVLAQARSHFIVEGKKKPESGRISGTTRSPRRSTARTSAPRSSKTAKRRKKSRKKRARNARTTK